MKKYWRVYKTLLKLNFATLLMYRANFYNNLISSIAWGLFSLFSIVLLTSNSTMVFGWSRDQLLLLNGLYGIIIGIYHVFLSANFERFSNIIHFGQLDSILTKPIDSQFLLSFWIIRFATFSRVIIAGIYTWYISNNLHLSLAFGSLAVITILMLLGLILLYSIWYIVITLTIWQTKLSNLTELMFSVTGVARYPQEMMHQLADYVFVFLLPFTLIINIPARIYLDKAESFDIILLTLLALGLFFLSRRFWKYALRFYTSASN